MNKKIMPGLALALLSACTTSVGQNFDDANLAKIKHDVTTRQELIALFGQPSSETGFPQGQAIMMWTWSQAKTMSTIQGRTLTIRLLNGRVESYAASQS